MSDVDTKHQPGAQHPRATVIRIEGAFADLRLDPGGGCCRCSQSRQCGVGQVASSAKARHLRVGITAELEPGCRVELHVPRKALNRAALVGYIVPVSGILLGAVAGQALSLGDVGVAMGAASGFLGGLWIIRGLETYGGLSPLVPTVKRISD